MEYPHALKGNTSTIGPLSISMLFYRNVIDIIWKVNGWNLKMEVWKVIFLFNWVICRFDVNGCTQLNVPLKKGLEWTLYIYIYTKHIIILIHMSIGNAEIHAIDFQVTS